MPEHVRIRYVRLNQVCRKALQQSVSKIQNWEKLASCFPEYAAVEEGAINLTNCQRQVVDFWMELSKREFEEIFRERAIEEKLNDLDDLISQAKKVQGSMRDESEVRTCIDELSPQQLINGNLHNSRLELSKELDERLSKMSGMNEQLQKELQELYADVEQESQEVHQLYDKYLGKDTASLADDALQQGLRNMLLELREEASN